MENRKMMYDVIFIISAQEGNRVKFETYNSKFRELNCEVPEREILSKMEDLSKKLNNHQDGCYGCLFCAD